MKPNIAILILLAVAFAAFLGFWKYSDRKIEDPAVSEIRTLAEQPRTKENRDAIRDVFRKKTEGMTDDQRMSFFEQSAPIFIPFMAKQFEERYDAFMKLSPAEQQKELDKRIDKMQQNGGPGGPGGANGERRGPPPEISQKKIDEFRKKMLDWTTPVQRAKFEDGIRRINERMQQRGLDPINGPGGRGF
jgi:hypothetical protein